MSTIWWCRVRRRAHEDDVAVPQAGHGAAVGDREAEHLGIEALHALDVVDVDAEVLELRANGHWDSR
jgi:hypothetical protein